MVLIIFSAKSDKFQKLFVSLHPNKTITFMSYFVNPTTNEK